MDDIDPLSRIDVTPAMIAAGLAVRQTAALGDGSEVEELELVYQAMRTREGGERGHARPDEDGLTETMVRAGVRAYFAALGSCDDNTDAIVREVWRAMDTAHPKGPRLD